MQTAITDCVSFSIFCLFVFIFDLPKPLGENYNVGAKLASWLCQSDCPVMPLRRRSGVTFPLHQCYQLPHKSMMKL